MKNDTTEPTTGAKAPANRAERRKAAVAAGLPPSAAPKAPKANKPKTEPKPKTDKPVGVYDAKRLGLLTDKHGLDRSAWAGSPTLSTKEKALVAVLTTTPQTAWEVAKQLGWTTNQVCGAFSVLLAKERVVATTEVRENPLTGNTVKVRAYALA